MKKLLSIILAVSMLLALSLPVLADEPLLISPGPEAPALETVEPSDSEPAEDIKTVEEEAPSALPSRVEISFRVGESVLKINGADVEVATPYVVGEGVTLVPLRVITEAFGATVGWDGETQTVTLDYPDVSIVLQIGNPLAEVNGKAQTLLAAPELPGSSTMVPLRFISETFGATVSYDEATEAILVVKEADGTGNTVVGAITTARIGDSYYGWSMENPTNMTMTERRFDGLYTTFAADENNQIVINIYPAEEDFNLAREFDATQQGLYGYSLVKADKLTAQNGYHIQARDKTDFIDLYAYNTEEYYIELAGFYANDNAEVRDECARILGTFTMEYTQEDTHDLSNAKDGWRTYEDKDLGISLPVPADYYQTSSEDTQNKIEFTALSDDDLISCLYISFYSASQVGDAKALAEKDNETNRTNYNEKLVSVSEVKEATYNNLPVYETALTISGTKDADAYIKDIFFQVGDYVYNLTIMCKKPAEDTFDFDAHVATVLNGLTIKPLDASEIGLIMRNDPNTTETYVSKTDKWSMTLPLSYTELQTQENGAFYISELNGIMFTYLNVELANANFTKAQSELKRTETSYIKDNGAKLITGASPRNIGGKQHAYHVLEIEIEGEKMYLHEYAYPANKNELHVFIVYFPELTYSQGNIKQVENIISTLKF